MDVRVKRETASQPAGQQKALLCYRNYTAVRPSTRPPHLFPSFLSLLSLSDCLSFLCQVRTRTYGMSEVREREGEGRPEPRRRR